MRKTIQTSALLLCAVALTACSDPASKMTDQQVLELIGSRSSFYDDDVPLAISPKMVECIELISGSNAEVYKDLPTQISGRFKTECRKQLSKKLADTEKNPLGAELKHLETVEFSKRVSKIHVESNKAVQAYQEKKRAEFEAEQKAEKERRKAEKAAEQQAIIDGAKKKLADIKTNIGSRLATIEQKCAEWDSEHTALKQRDKHLANVYGWRPVYCSKTYPIEVQEDVTRAEKAVSEMKINTDSFVYLSVPTFYKADLKSLDQVIQNIDEKITNLKSK